MLEGPDVGEVGCGCGITPVGVVDVQERSVPKRVDWNLDPRLGIGGLDDFVYLIANRLG
jgi:hypothetical protein